MIVRPIAIHKLIVWENVQFIIVTAGGTQIYHWYLNGKIVLPKSKYFFSIFNIVIICNIKDTSL